MVGLEAEGKEWCRVECACCCCGVEELDEDVKGWWWEWEWRGKGGMARTPIDEIVVFDDVDSDFIVGKAIEDEEEVEVGVVEIEVFKRGLDGNVAGSCN